MKLTYRKLLETLQTLSDEQLNQNVMVCDVEEDYFEVLGLYFAQSDNDTLTLNQPYFVTGMY